MPRGAITPLYTLLIWLPSTQPRLCPSELTQEGNFPRAAHSAVLADDIGERQAGAVQRGAAAVDLRVLAFLARQL